MDVGSRVKDKNNGSVGIIERQNLSSFLVSFEGGKKLWRKAHELELATNVRSSAASPKVTPSPVTANRGGAPVAQPPTTQQTAQQPRSALGSSGGVPSPVAPRAALGGGSGPPVATPRPAVGAAAPISRPSLGGPAPTPSSPQMSPKQQPVKQQFDSTDTRQSHHQPSNTHATPASPKPVDAGKTLQVPSASTLEEDLWNIDFDELDFGDVIGSGKYGEVYLGTYLGTPVAIKKILEIDDDTKITIERELFMLKGVRHPNIVQFLGLCQNKGDIYFVTEYMDRGDLFDILFFGEAPLSWKLKLKIALDIAMPCYYLQAKGILHRDLKSQNILLSSSNYKAKLCDLGLARALDTPSRRLTFVGTDRWMAPEICLGIDYDYKVDVFSFGVVLMEIITQSVPDERRVQDKFAFNEGAFRSKVPRSCPAGFTQLAVDCTKLDPRTRPTFKSILDRVKRMYDEIEEEDED